MLQELIDTPVKTFGFDTETTGINYGKDRFKVITFYLDGKSHFYRYDPKDKELLNKLFNNSSFKVAHSAPFDINFLHKEGITVTNPICSKILAALHDDRDDKVGYGLKPLAEKYLGYETTDFKALLKKLGIKPNELDKLYESELPQEFVNYATEDAKYCYELSEIFYPFCAEEMPKALDLEMRLTPVVAKIQRQGIPIDIPFLEANQKILGHKIMAVHNEMAKEFGQELNFNSSKQLRELLYEKLKLKPVKNTPGGHPSTDHESLTKMESQHPFLSKILEYRGLQKQLTTYVDPWLDLQQDGILYTYLNPWGAKGGRFSSSDPNLQNVPSSEKAKKRGMVPLREAFVAPKGFKFIKADYSQLELRILALLSGDEKLTQAFQSGEDIHALTQSFLGLSDRRIAKVINFGIAYGMSAEGVMTTLWVDEGIRINRIEARRLIDKFYRAYPGVTAYKYNIELQLRRKRYVETLLGRRRHFDLPNNNRIAREEAQRQAVNMPIQGFGGELMKMALIDIDKNISDYTRTLLTVHDEVLLMVEEHLAEKAAREVAEIMENVYPCKIPLKVDTKILDRWC